MRKIIILFILLISSSVYCEELPTFFDAGIDAHNLLDQESTKALLENTKENQKSGFFIYEFALKGKHIIQLIVHPGSIKHAVSEIHIIDNNKKKLIDDYPNKAITAKGIFIGITKEDLVRKIGRPSYITDNNHYEYKSEYDQGILKKYNMPIYYGSYKFVNNHLVSFSFGFEYP